MTVDLDRLAAALELLAQRARGRRVALADVGGEDQDAPRAMRRACRGMFVSASEAQSDEEGAHDDTCRCASAQAEFTARDAAKRKEI